MPLLGLTNVFASATTALAAQVNQNFNDLKNFLNVTKLDYLNIQDGGLRAVNYQDGSVTRAKLEDAEKEPVGVMKMYAGAVAPTGYLLCQGQSLQRTDYPALFAVTGTAFGNVDANTFNLPDFRGRIPVGVGGHADHDAMGENDGATLANRRVRHAHTTPDHLHSLSAHTHTYYMVDHTHVFSTGVPSSTDTVQAGTSGTFKNFGINTHTHSGTTGGSSIPGWGYATTGPNTPNTGAADRSLATDAQGASFLAVNVIVKI